MSTTIVEFENKDIIVQMSGKGPIGPRGHKGDPGEPGPSEWGVIQGNISDQTDLQNALNGKANVGDSYTKAEDNALLAQKADLGVSYTKAETDNLLAQKADSDDVYDKTSVDSLLSGKADTDDVYDKSQTYTKTEVDTALSAKANSADVYSKSDVDSALADKADADDVYSKTEADALLADKADSADLGDLAFQDSVNYSTQVTNKPDFGGMLSYSESSMKATRNYSKGALIAVGDKLYRATTGIASGSNLTVGSNVTATTIEAEIATKANSADVYAKTEVYTKAETDDLLEGKLDVTPTTTVTGEIVTFESKVDAPVKSLSVAIEPVQDLHGYDNPWPAGGGKNLLKIDLPYDDGTVSGLTFTHTDDTFTLKGTASGTYKILQMGTYPAIVSGNTYSLSAVVTGTNPKCQITLRYINANNETIYSISINKAGSYKNSLPYSSEDTIHHVNFIIEGLENGGSYDLTAKVQFEKANTATDWTPYENICPISGWSQAKVQRTGKNLLNMTNVVTDAYISVATGNIATVSEANVFYAYVPKNTNFVCSSNAGDRCIIVGYKIAPETIVGSYYDTLFVNSPSQQLTATFNSADCTFVVIYQNRYQASKPTQIQLELGSTVTSYESYQGQSVTIDLDGTRYGGVLDVLTGELTVTDIAFTKAWNAMNDGGTQSGITKKYFSISDLGLKGYGQGICDILPFLISTSYSSAHYLVNNNATYIEVYMPASTTGNPEFTFVQPLATPLTVQLSPSQMQTLLGQNAIWASTGDVMAAEYRSGAGRMAYLDGISLGNVEASMTVSRDYPTGAVIVIGDDIVKTTAVIQAGDTLTVGTNCTTATIADWILSVASSQ